jgi:hypothetical protein
LDAAAELRAEVLRAGRKKWLEVAVVGLAAATALVPLPGAAVERWYSVPIYPLIQHTLTPVSNVVRFALFDVACLVITGMALVALTRAGQKAWHLRSAKRLLGTVGHCLTATAVLYLVFLFLWGLNYRRLPMTERLVIAPEPPSSDAVLKLGLDSVGMVNALYDAAHVREAGEEEWQDRELRRAFEVVQRTLSPAAPAVPGRLKRSLFGPYFRWTSVDGMINPFGLEVLVNPDLLPVERRFVLAHEWSHLAGYANEAEASYVGWLTCLRADARAQYSGWLYVYWQISGEVTTQERTRLASGLSPGPRSDVNAIIDRLRRGQLPLLRDMSWRVYDQYLKVNRVDAGIRSYGAVVTLIVQTRFEKGWTPIRRDGGPP